MRVVIVIEVVVEVTIIASELAHICILVKKPLDLLHVTINTLFENGILVQDRGIKKEICELRRLRPVNRGVTFFVLRGREGSPG